MAVKGRGKVQSRQVGSGTFRDEAQALYTCAMSPNAVCGRVWVAYGGNAGVIRCQRIGLV